MKISGIICEYNPLHNGHVHHIQETRRHGATHIICVLSSNFVQRGDVALLSKFDRAQLAVRAGADLVIELPVAFSCAAAEDYAKGAISLLNSLGVVEELSFGSSTGRLETIQLLTEAAASTTEIYGDRIREQMQQGISYPAAVWEIVRQRYGSQVADKMQDPNNLLAIEYMKAMQRQKVSFEPFTIPRRCVEHDSPLPKDEFASASFIRKAIAEHDPIYGSYIPDFCADLLLRRMKEGRTANIGQLERAVLFKMRTVSFSELMKLPDMTEALAHRFIDNRNANSLEEFYLKVGTKCYTMSRIRRLSMCAMIGIHRDIHRCMPPYARILSFSDRGREMLGMIQKKSAIPVNTSLAKLRDTSEVARAFALTEERASHVYGLAQQSISSAEEDYRARITMVEDRK